MYSSRLRRWLLCRPEFKGRHRTIRTPGRWTELFFLDEATELAAGHRPCCECRRDRFLAFRDAWAAGVRFPLRAEAIPVAMIDDRLHAERVGPGRTKQTFEADLDDLPDGVFVTTGGGPGGAWLVRGGELLAWSPGGYTVRSPRPVGEVVAVLTPRSTLAAIRAGYTPEVHPSAQPRDRGQFTAPTTGPHGWPP